MDELRKITFRNIEEMNIDFNEMTEEQKLKFQGFFLAMCMLRETKKEKPSDKLNETA